MRHIKYIIVYRINVELGYQKRRKSKKRVSQTKYKITLLIYDITMQTTVHLQEITTICTVGLNNVNPEIAKAQAEDIIIDQEKELQVKKYITA